jgi:hypothetical protein
MLSERENERNFKEAMSGKLSESIVCGIRITDLSFVHEVFEEVGWEHRNRG